MTRKCLLDAHKRGGCVSCQATCQHRIALEGLNGKGGRLGAAKVPSEYRDLTLATSPARTEQSKIYGMLDAYIATYERQLDENAERIKSLYLWSESPGTGKTTTASALLNEYVVAHYLGSLKRSTQPLQRPALFLDVNTLQTDYNLATMTHDESGLSQVTETMRKAMDVSYLVMDDVGIRSASESFKSIVHAIINARTTNGKPTIFTSNLPIDEMATVFDARLADRMRDQCVVLHFAGESKRGKR